MRERNMRLIKEGIKHIPKYKDVGAVGVYPLAKSKNNIFRVMVADDVLKVRVYPFEPQNLAWHRELVNVADFRVPKIVDVVGRENVLLKFVEWIEGTPLNEVIKQNEFQFLPDDDFVEWGRAVARLHNCKSGTMNFSLTELWWWNFLKLPDGAIIPIDMSKLNLANYPEKAVVAEIGMNDTMPLDKKKAFIDGYTSVRKFHKFNAWEALEYMTRKVQYESKN